jgi:plastocyanin
MQQHVHFESIGNVIMVKPSILYLSVGDTVTFHADDNNTYDVVIPNKEKFFVSADGATIDDSATENNSPVTTAVNAKPIRTEKGYAVTTPGGGTPLAPPKIIIIS